MSYLALGFLVAAVFLFSAFIFASRINYKNRFNATYHLRSHFPYEFNYHGKFTDNIFGNLIYVLYAGMVVAFLVFFDKNHTDGYLVFGLVSGGILLVLLSCLVYIPIDHLRLHTGIVAGAFIISLMFPFSFVLAGYFKYDKYQSVPALVGMIIAAVCCVFVVIITLNPKLSRWAELEKETQEDGSSTMKRPKWFTLAYSEWALLLVYQISLIAGLVVTI